MFLNRQYYWLSLIFCLSFCYPQPGDYVRKAKYALEDENAILAVYYFQKAYEASLEDSFFIADKDEVFSKMKLSNDQNHLILVTTGKNESKFIYRDLKKDEEFTDSVAGVIKQIYISVQGSYILFTSQKYQDQNCYLCIYDTLDYKQVYQIENISCKDHSAVSQKGIVLFMQEEKIKFLDLRKIVNANNISYPEIWTSKSPDKPFKKEKAKVFFAFSTDDKPFMSYGIAGRYKLYNLSNHSLKLITKEASLSKIFFIQKNNQPGVLTGGASQQRITFFHPDHYNRVIKKYPLATWKDSSFFKANYYYFIESSRLHVKKNNKITQLPFLAKEVFARSNGSVFFLSAIGTAMQYNGKLPNKLSQTIFDKALDIDESK